MYGRLKSGANYSLDDSRITETGGTATTISNRNEIDVQEYKSPFSVGIGFEFMLRKKVRLSLSGEFFNKTDELVYFQETDDSFNGTSEGNADVTVSVKAKRESVRNIAFGIQYLKNEKVTLIGGFRTDFNESSRLLINDTAEYLGSTPNVFHLSGGGTFKYKKNIFSIGIDLGYGKRSGGQQLADLTDINSDNLFTFSGNNNVSSQFFSTMLFITYDFIFNNF